MKFAVEHLADQTLPDPIDGLGQDRGILPVVNREGDALLLAGQTSDPLKLFTCAYKGLLAEYVHTLAQCVNYEFCMGWRRCAYVNEIKGFTSKQLFRRPIDTDIGQQLFGPSSPLRRWLAHCLHGNPALFEPAGKMSPLGHVAEPDDGSS
jgi:hypothetical protein